MRLQEWRGLAEGHDFSVAGVPMHLAGATDLWHRDKSHFQQWAGEQVEGVVTTKRPAAGGIDGRLSCDAPSTPGLQRMVIEVKGGKNVTIAAGRAGPGV